MRVLFIFLLFLFAYADDTYTPGEGIQLAHLSLYLGGYLSNEVIMNKKQKELDIDEFALMLYGDFARSGFMSELEWHDLYSKNFNQKKEHLNTKLYIERLNYSYEIDENSEIVLGKFLTRAGFWNRMPINVLRDTTSDPAFVDTIFPKMSTGVLYNHYTHNSTLSLTLQYNPGLHSDYNNFRLKRHFALAYSLRKESSEMRLSGGYFFDTKDSFYSTISYLRESFYWKVMVEAGLRKTAHSKEAFDIYTQNVWHIATKHDLIIRLETYQNNTKHYDALLGYTYRPYPFMALKSELDLFSQGFGTLLFSFSMMF